MNPSYPKLHLVAKGLEQDPLAALDQLARAKVGEVVQAYIDAEVNELLERVRYERRSADQPKAYRDGYDPERTIITGAGAIPVRRPRVRGVAFESAVLPKYQRRTETVDRTLHKLWLEGLAHRDFEPALRALLGEEAALSASTIARVNAQFRGEFDAWKTRSLEHEYFAYWWADGVHLGAGPADERRVLLVVIGVDLQGEKHLLALDEAMAESEVSWSNVLRDLKDRGLAAAQLAIADGANGFWNALTAVYPQSKQQRCWLHKLRNVLDKVPKNKQREVHQKLGEIMASVTRSEAIAKIESLAAELQTHYPKAAACLRDDLDRMLTYFAFPSESWKSLRTTNPIESVFSSVRTRTNAAKRLRSGASATYLVFKLIERLSKTWHRIHGYKTISTTPLAKNHAA